jgi:acetyl esterase
VAGADIAVHVHRPPGDGPLPVLVYIHGGGWILGTAQQTDRVCRRLAERTSSLVLSIDYRLAPEFPFPTPVEDCYAALIWIVEHATELGGDPTDVVLSGQSAGGNLAAAVALMARDRGGPALRGQWLDVPAVDLTMPEDDSIRAFGQGFGLDLVSTRQTIALYAAEDHLTDPYVSPLLAPSLEGLPPAVITVAGCDLLSSQGERYGDALRAAGVPVRFTRWAGHLHATMTLTNLHPSSQAYEDEVVAGLAEFRALASRSV